ncbi:MAG TPA: DUF5313 family protein [Gordonia sp. (in: high G+C Gram-positive bacteria)]|uniref:DUF5313 family protein n=1 Tax=unclassified Gordonia (in: high G+C Gram-positive bacteria) TaxID=2657482 RepID=UPI000F938983|nr:MULTISPECIES: DUF5313 family protein [unclassified Gordonia (in: high G+C Gram-positive bacteria)]RUP41237.1 MAG: hypothetical protein EKK60_01835 [Gordonia sp. (in: high G+C Gram-positive bacteria)]HNP55564.1 DUF5313 family protein [Gordonia sp. (in: high G+C Gram-positive bacteria)]HRC51034.1 DUF5313 family protein [Gordonia sp. (in: high G+C Gram-positive bacteria)]
MSNSERPRPTLWEFIPYAYGRRTYGKRPLPAKYQNWVREDNAGPGATRRVVFRFMLPVVILLSPFLLTHKSVGWGTAIIVTLPIFLGALYFTFVFDKYYRRATLQRNGLDPALADETIRKKSEADHLDYERRHGRA